MLYMKKRGGYSVNEFTSRLLFQAVHRQATSVAADCRTAYAHAATPNHLLRAISQMLNAAWLQGRAPG
jgi:hypothetical protein